MGVNTVNKFIPIFIAIGSKKTVPNRKNIAIVAIGIGELVMVMNFMHIGRNYKIAEHEIQFARQYDIGMIELGEDYREGLIGKNQPHRTTNKEYSNCGKNEANDAFAGMMAVGWGSIYKCIGVVD